MPAPPCARPFSNVRFDRLKLLPASTKKKRDAVVSVASLMVCPLPTMVMSPATSKAVGPGKIPVVGFSGASVRSMRLLAIVGAKKMVSVPPSASAARMAERRVGVRYGSRNDPLPPPIVGMFVLSAVVVTS